MNVRIHRGTKQIGGTCIEIENDGERIAIDYGLPLDGNAADKSLVPSIDKESLIGVVISHPHIDHYGLLHYLPGDIPVAMGAAGKNLIRTAVPFTGQTLPPLSGPNLEHMQPIQLGSFRITPYLMDHSAFDAYSLLIEANGKRIFYSGDFRAHGRKSSLFEKLIQNPPENVDVLLMEGSSLSRLDDEVTFPTEQELENQFMSSFNTTSGMVMVHASTQNIDRIVSIYRACKRTGRTLLIDLYAAAILESTGNHSIPQSSWPGMALYVPECQRRLIKRNGWFDLLERHSKNRIYLNKISKTPSQYVALFRPLLTADLEKADCLYGASFVYSQWEGYLKEGAYCQIAAWLKKHDIPLTQIHTSGHASPVDLKRFSSAISPKSLVPIHSFAPEKYEALFSNVLYKNDAEWWRV